jgi:hypothetical protein
MCYSFVLGNKFVHAIFCAVIVGMNSTYLNTLNEWTETYGINSKASDFVGSASLILRMC